MDDFCIGDEVVIRDWDDMASEFGLDSFGDIKCNKCFSSIMKHLCGKRAVIVAFKPNRVIELDFLDTINGRTSFFYTTDMIRYAKSLDVKDMPVCDIFDWNATVLGG